LTHFSFAERIIRKEIPAKGLTVVDIFCTFANSFYGYNEYLLFTMTTTTEGKGAIALASSKDAKKLKDLGPALITF
jgi:hypothetical protein